MFGNIVTQKHSIQYSISEMVYDVSFTATNNQPNLTSLLGYIWYIYSNRSAGVIGYDFDYYFGPCLHVEIGSTKKNIRGFEHMLSLL